MTLILKTCQRRGIENNPAFHHHRRVFCDKMIVMLVRLACQQDRILRCEKFHVCNGVFLCAMMVTLLLKRCERQGMGK